MTRLLAAWFVLSVPAGFLIGCCFRVGNRRPEPTPDETPSMLSVADQITAGAARARVHAIADGRDPDAAVARFTDAMCAHPSVPKEGRR